MAVTAPDGRIIKRYLVRDVGSVDFQILQYNINKALMTLHSIGLENAPAMVKPEYAEFADGTLLETIRFNAYYCYKLERTGKLPDVSGTGFEGVIP